MVGAVGVVTFLHLRTQLRAYCKTRYAASVACFAHFLFCNMQDAAGKRTLRKFREAFGKTRPTLLETTIGLDIVIPGKTR